MREFIYNSSKILQTNWFSLAFCSLFGEMVCLGKLGSVQ